MWTFFMVIAVCIILLFDFINKMLEKRIAAKEEAERRIRLDRMEADYQQSVARIEYWQRVLEESDRRTAERARLAIGITEADDKAKRPDEPV